jgi:hypothetical protein
MPVSLYIGEVHSEVVPTGGEAPTRPGADPGAAVVDAAEQRWREARCRAEWLAARTAAEGFDD